MTRSGKRRGDTTQAESSPKRTRQQVQQQQQEAAVETEAAGIGDDVVPAELEGTGAGSENADIASTAAAAEVAAAATASATKTSAEEQFELNSQFSSQNKPNLSPTNPANFDHFLFQLLSFKADNNNYHVPKEDHPALHAWLQYLKREFKLHSTKMGLQEEAAAAAAAAAAGAAKDDEDGTAVDPTAATTLATEGGSLTPEQIKVLHSLHVPLTSRGDDHWNRFYKLLVEYKERHGHVLVPRLCEIPGLGDWVTDQRRQYKAWKQGGTSQLTADRRTKLQSLGFVWQVRNRPEWEQRFNELLAYKEKYGDTKVPQHYKANKALGKWVAKQREQYKLLNKGQHSFLTPYRLERLNSVGFVWQVRTSIDQDDMVVAAAAAANAAAAAVNAGTSPAAAGDEAVTNTNNVPTPLAADTKMDDEQGSEVPQQAETEGALPEHVVETAQI